MKKIITTLILIFTVLNLYAQLNVTSHSWESYTWNYFENKWELVKSGPMVAKIVMDKNTITFIKSDIILTIVRVGPITDNQEYISESWVCYGDFPDDIVKLFIEKNKNNNSMIISMVTDKVSLIRFFINR